MKLIELFGGIGACTKALKNIGMNVDVVDYVEIDKYCRNGGEKCLNYLKRK